jgi:class 3 adenylate cyclase
LASLSDTHEVARVAHVQADIVGWTAIAAQKTLGAGKRSAVLDHRLGRIVHRAGRLLSRQKPAQLALSKHLRASGRHRCA